MVEKNKVIDCRNALFIIAENMANSFGEIPYTNFIQWIHTALYGAPKICSTSGPLMAKSATVSFKAQQIENIWNVLCLTTVWTSNSSNWC